MIGVWRKIGPSETREGASTWVRVAQFGRAVQRHPTASRCSARCPS